MSEPLIRKSWYDGWIYANLIDSDSIELRERILTMINEGSSVIDVGCGTGSLALKLARKGHKVTAVDISQKMIEQARKRQEKSGLNHATFLHANAVNLPKLVSKKHDYATMSFAIHEMPPSERVALLRALKEVAYKVVILDYHIPPPQTFWGKLVWAIEFMAGRDHFRNFKDFAGRGGLTPLFNEAGFWIEKERVNRLGIFRMVTAIPKT